MSSIYYNTTNPFLLQRFSFLDSRKILNNLNRFIFTQIPFHRFLISLYIYICTFKYYLLICNPQIYFKFFHFRNCICRTTYPVHRVSSMDKIFSFPPKQNSCWEIGAVRTVRVLDLSDGHCFENGLAVGAGVRVVAFRCVSGEARSAVESRRAFVTRVHLAAVHSAVPFEAAFVGKAVAAYFAGERLRANGVVEDVLRPVRQTAEHLAAILARVRSIVVVAVHVLLQIRLPPKRLIARLARVFYTAAVTFEFIRCATFEKAGALSRFRRGGNVVFFPRLDRCDYRCGRRGRRRGLLRGDLTAVWRARTMPASVWSEICRTTEHLVALGASVFRVLDAGAAMLGQGEGIGINVLAQLANVLRLRQRAARLRKLEFLVRQNQRSSDILRVTSALLHVGFSRLFSAAA